MLPNEFLDSKKNEQKLNLIRRYPFEIAIISLCFCVGYLFIQQTKLNSKVADYLLNDRGEMITLVTQTNAILTESNKVLKENTEATKQVKDLLFFINQKTKK